MQFQTSEDVVFVGVVTKEIAHPQGFLRDVHSYACVAISIVSCKVKCPSVPKKNSIYLKLWATHLNIAAYFMRVCFVLEPHAAAMLPFPYLLSVARSNVPMRQDFLSI